MLFVGLDLAGVESRSTGLCLLTANVAKTALLYTDDEIVTTILKSKPSIVAIDAPLYLPPGRTSLEDKTGPHLRESDCELLKMGIKLFPATLGPMRKLTTRGIKLREKFESAGLRVIEVYPGGAQDVLGIPRKKQGVHKLLAGLQALGIQGLNNTLSDHELDAATCAYVGKLFLEGKAISYGAPNQGIVLPKKEK